MRKLSFMFGISRVFIIIIIFFAFYFFNTCLIFYCLESAKRLVISDVLFFIDFSVVKVFVANRENWSWNVLFLLLNAFLYGINSKLIGQF